jgi:hypothetical protein
MGKGYRWTYRLPKIIKSGTKIAYPNEEIGEKQFTFI